MAQKYEVLTEALTEHAGNVDRISDQMGQAAAAGQQMSLPSDTYGPLCVDLPVMINPLQELAAMALTACAKHLSSAARGIRATARDYAAVDEANELSLQRARHSTEVR
ncbi:MAG TPA: type VII secretion target [Pseudonocardiaceae bacterium]